MTGHEAKGWRGFPPRQHAQRLCLDAMGAASSVRVLITKCCISMPAAGIDTSRCCGTAQEQSHDLRLPDSDGSLAFLVRPFTPLRPRIGEREAPTPVCVGSDPEPSHSRRTSTLDLEEAGSVGGTQPGLGQRRTSTWARVYCEPWSRLGGSRGGTRPSRARVSRIVRNRRREAVGEQADHPRRFLARQCRVSHDGTLGTIPSWRDRSLFWILADEVGVAKSELSRFALVLAFASRMRYSFVSFPADFGSRDARYTGLLGTWFR